MAQDLDDLEFLESLKKDFLEECQGNLEKCEECLLNFEQNKNDDEIRSYLRVLHSIKGSAKAVEYNKMAAAIHQIESLGSNTGHPQFIEVSLSLLDELKDVLKTIKAGGDSEAEVKLDQAIKKAVLG